MNKVEQLRETAGMVQDWEGTEWAPISLVQEITGWTTAELEAVITEALEDPAFRAEPQPHRHRLTEADRAYAPIIGGEPRHLLRWER